jgi:hypothetical protein
MTSLADEPAITDDFMRGMLQKSRSYSILILKKGPQYGSPGSDRIIWEHGRRNFALRADGRLAIVCPVGDGNEVTGVGIFTTDPEETRAIMDEDPGVAAGVFVYEVHASRGFPGDALPD